MNDNKYELEQIYKLVKETMHNWEVDGYYLYFIHATCRRCDVNTLKDDKVENFLVSVGLKGKQFYVSTEVEITRDLHYRTEGYIDTKEELVQYLEKLDKLGIKDLDNAKEEMNKALEKHFENIFLGQKEEN